MTEHTLKSYKKAIKTTTINKNFIDKLHNIDLCDQLPKTISNTSLRRVALVTFVGTSLLILASELLSGPF